MMLRTTLLQSGKTATGFQVPEEVIEKLGAGKRPPVRVTINKHTYRSTVAVMGGKYLVGVSAENRAAAGISGGDAITVELELDTAPREVAVPADLAKALSGNKTAKATFEKMSYSHKLRHVLAIESARTPETRARRIAKAISDLAGAST